MHRRRGFLLIMSLLLSSLLSVFVAASLLRATAELDTAERTLALQQALYLAEAGLDAKLKMLRVDSTDTADIPPVTLGYGSYEVDVSPGPTPDLWILQSLGQTTQADQRLRVMVRLPSGPLPVPGAVTMVWEGAGVWGSHRRGADFHSLEFFDDGTSGGLVVNGCDAGGGGCLPGIAATSTSASDTGLFNETYDDLENDHTNEGYFGNRLIGTPGHLDQPGSVSANPLEAYLGTSEYSIQKSVQTLSTGGLGFDMLNDLAAFAKDKADDPGNDCYYDCTNDDGPACTSSPDSATQFVRFTGTAIKTLGSIASPKVCYIEFPFDYNATGPVDAAGTMGPVVGPNDPDSNSFVKINGSTGGAGILVVKGELVIEDTFEYDGILLVVGPTGTLKLEDNVTIRGAAFVGSTEGYCESGSCSTSNLRFEHTQFKPYGSGSVRYDAAQVEAAQQLLATWTPPGGGGGGGSGSQPELLSWQATDPNP